MDFNRFVSHRLEAFRDRPRMWGSTNETIEVLARQLLEVEIRHYQPEAYDGRARIIMDFYTKEMGRRYGSGALPLYARTPELFKYEPKVLDFDQALFEICHKVRTDVRAQLELEPPFEVLPIHRLEYMLQLRIPNAIFGMSRPLRADGVWTLDVTNADRWVSITWQTPDRYSVSKVTNKDLYGEGPDEVFSSSGETLKRAIDLLSEVKDSV